jgi:hypothetical protein
LVGAGAGLGAGAGAWVGGASVGAGAGAEVVPLLAGCVLWVLAPVAEGVGFAAVEAAADGDPLAAGDVPLPAAVCPEDWVEAEVLAA